MREYSLGTLCYVIDVSVEIIKFECFKNDLLYDFFLNSIQIKDTHIKVHNMHQVKYEP